MGRPFKYTGLLG